MRCISWMPTRSQSLNTDQGNSDVQAKSTQAPSSARTVSIPQYRSGQFRRRFRPNRKLSTKTIVSILNTDQGNSDFLGERSSTSPLPWVSIPQYRSGQFRPRASYTPWNVVVPRPVSVTPSCGPQFWGGHAILGVRARHLSSDSPVSYSVFRYLPAKLAFGLGVLLVGHGLCFQRT